MVGGPKRKFYLIKEHGDKLRCKGFKPNEMSCREIETALAKIEANDKAMAAMHYSLSRCPSPTGGNRH